jgi:hypothetical protein
LRGTINVASWLAVGPGIWIHRLRAEDAVKAGKLEFVGAAGEVVECDLVLMSEWKSRVLTRFEV